jgi:large subunit ribosomal protein L3
MLLDSRKNFPTFGQEIAVPITVLDCPPIQVVGVRAYRNTTDGLKVLSESWAKDLPKELKRKIHVIPKENLNKIENSLERISKIRLLVSTQPRLSGVGKKKPEVFEVEIGGKDNKEKFEFAKQLLGKEIPIKDVLREGELVDAIAITKGKGTAGVMKRFGVKKLNRKSMKKRRHIGTLGSQTPGRVRWTIAQAGQLGFQTRTELNKRILKIGDKGQDITPKSGFNRYGVVKGNYVVLEGSVPGPKKRIIMLRPAIRPGKIKLLVPEIREIVM